MPKEVNSSKLIDLNTIVNNYTVMLNELKNKNFDNVCEMIENSKRIIVVATGTVQRLIAQELQRSFLRMGIMIMVINGKSEIVNIPRWVNEEDLIKMFTKYLLTYGLCDVNLKLVTKDINDRRLKMIKIISDSSTLYSISEGQANNIDISPLVVTIDDKTYMEYEEINSEEFIDIINKGHIPKSSQPAIGGVVQLQNKYGKDEIINITMADGLSGTYNSACMAKNMDNNPDRIDVINSKTLCGPHKYLVDLATKLAKEGLSREQIVNEINKLIETSKSFLIPKDFDFLVRGGRISSLAGKVGSMISLVPVMTLSEDAKSMVKFTAKRTYKKAIKKIVDHLKEVGVNSDYKYYISHGCNIDLAKEAESIIRDLVENIDLEIKKLGPAFITQGGPSCLAIQVIKKYK